MDGKLESNPEDEKLARSVIEDDNAKADGNLIQEGVNQGLGAFVPETLFSNIVKNYRQAKQLYGEKILSEVTGYSPDYVEKNAKIPEFQKELESNIGERIKRLQKNNYISKDGIIQEKGYKLSSLVMYTQELDQLEAKGLLGEKENKEKAHYGQRKDSDFYKKGDRYADIDVMKTLKVAIRRGHTKIQAGDLKIFERESKGNLEIIYAIDASGSMKGKKIEMSKKAGIALAYKAIENKDRVGLLAFGDRIKAKVQPTTDFTEFLEKTARIQANNETNFPEAIEESIRTFSQDNNMKHLIFITDGMPTAGEDPEKEALEAISKAVSANITVSMIGIEVQEDSAKFLREAAEIGKGKFHNVANVEELDVIILQDYDSQ